MTTSAALSTTIAPPALDELCINTLRFLAVDMVQKANSGHPGLPMGSASMAYALWDRSLKFNPRDPLLARPGPLHSLGRTWMCALVCPASCHGLRLAAGGTQEVSPMGKPYAGPSGIRQDSWRRSHHRALGARTGQWRRHGHCRGGARGALQSTGSPDRGPLYLCWLC